MNQTESVREDMRGLLDTLGKTISDVSRKAKVTRATVHGIVTGRQDARMGTLEAITNALGVPWERVVAAFRVTRGAEPEAVPEPAAAAAPAPRPEPKLESPWVQALRKGR